ncbi:choice-of-anchor D domain-containing protein [Telmatobacter sp. DSM 110680]|uniref:Choice-of-anchor D domain-containing protein n=2 Tax=Telmatobacter sp. DSM 110680 TaxID=3036704 RepID=A0AAU7DR03_9BACT
MCITILCSLSLISRAQNISVSPRLLAFPNTTMGTTSAPLTVTINNNQTSTLTIASIQVAAPYAETNNCGSTVAPNTTCTVAVKFSPTAVKYYSSSLTITDSAGNSPQVISLTGNGVKSTVSYTPPTGGIYFYNQIVSTPSTPQPVTIKNIGSTSLTFNSIISTADYPYTTNCGNGAGGGTLAAGASCTIEVEFDPQAIGKRTTNLTISESADATAIMIPLQGTGISGTPGASVAVTPSAPCVQPSATEQFAAIVTSESNTGVNWLVDNVAGGNSTVGTITANGLYTAPPYVGSHIVKAVSQASNSVSGSSAISVNSSPTFEIYPFVASIPTGGQQTFQAQQCLVPDSGPNVSYTVDNIAGGNSTVGTITNNGVYTAPPTPGKHTIRVTDSTLNKSSGAVVTAFTSITADFNSRANTTAVVPSGMFGYGRGESLRGTSDRELLTQGGLSEARISALISTVYATQTPDWTKIDPMIEAIQSAGQHALIQLNQSPSWLQPTSGRCANSVYAAPTNISEWAQIAAAYVAHFDSKFPNVVQDYEIWNEPNATGMCTTLNQMNTYMNIYAAAAPAMKTQAAEDGATIRIGGPVISGYSQVWISTLLSNTSTAPYVDFVSYHQYFFGQSQLEAKWDQYTGVPSLYEMTQDPSVGAVANYNKTLAQVALGKQPGGASTPIYVTEFNSNWAFFKDCCRSDNTYAPVWNSLYVTDMLDSVYNGSAHVPNKLYYFAGSAYPYFCLIGVQDPNMDCLYSAGATPVPYPQYYAYQLFGGSSYLGLSAGGYMAKSISSPTGGGGLATTAFYTSTEDSIVITNPTATSYPQITVTFANPGFSDAQGTLYQIQNGSQINSTPISFSSQGTSRTATIEVPPYSVQAVSFK